jgi:hypothetical protein
MSATYTRGKLVARLLLYALLASLAFALVHGYQVIRKERVSTRLAVRLAEGENEIEVSLPSGHFQIHFTPEPNVSPAVIVSAQPVLPAQISTRIMRQDGSTIVEPTPREYVTFSIDERDAFRPLRLLVNITKTNQCKIYMNVASGF